VRFFNALTRFKTGTEGLLNLASTAEILEAMNHED
jgi:hypothetical protein